MLRYIIIPLAILLYLFWSWKSIKDIYNERKDIYPNLKDYTSAYLLVHFLAVLGLIGCGGVKLLELIIKYW